MCEFCKAYEEIKNGDLTVKLFLRTKDPSTGFHGTCPVASVEKNNVRYCVKCGRRLKK